MSTRMLRFVVSLGFFLPAIWAQNEGAISGTVQDSSGAVLPSASVKLTNHEQGTVRSAQTNQSGVYQFTFLPAGTYDLEVGAQRLQDPETDRIITLAVAQNTRIDVSLEVGNVSENVTVVAEAATVNTESGEVGAVVDNTKVTEMPLNGRQMWALTELVPNVMPPAQNSSLSFRGGFNVAGQNETSNNFLLNGFDNNDPDVYAPNFRPSIDAIEEFNVLTGVYSAQYGYGSGGQVIVTTKSGTNAFHGSAFEYLRNQVMDARNFFQTGPTPSFKQNDFGGTFGGPIIKNKTFFFYSYEGLRQASEVQLSEHGSDGGRGCRRFRRDSGDDQRSHYVRHQFTGCSAGRPLAFSRNLDSAEHAEPGRPVALDVLSAAAPTTATPWPGRCPRTITATTTRAGRT